MMFCKMNRACQLNDGWPCRCWHQHYISKSGLISLFFSLRTRINHFLFAWKWIIKQTLPANRGIVNGLLEIHVVKKKTTTECPKWNCPYHILDTYLISVARSCTGNMLKSIPNLDEIYCGKKRFSMTMKLLNMFTDAIEWNELQNKAQHFSEKYFQALWICSFHHEKCFSERINNSWKCFEMDDFHAHLMPHQFDMDVIRSFMERMCDMITK